MRSVLVVAVLAAAGWGAYTQLRQADPLDKLTDAPLFVPPGSYGGIQDVSSLSLEVGPEPGRHTVIAFYNLGCSACVTLSRHLQYLSRLRPDVAIRLVRLNSPLAMKFNVASVPHIIIYDCNGSLVAQDRGSDKAGLELLYNWMKRELEKSGGA